MLGLGRDTGTHGCTGTQGRNTGRGGGTGTHWGQAAKAQQLSGTLFLSHFGGRGRLWEGLGRSRGCGGTWQEVPQLGSPTSNEPLLLQALERGPLDDEAPQLALHPLLL